MKTEYDLKKRDNIVELVNPIVKQAFGRLYKGNYNEAGISVWTERVGQLDRLALIARYFCGNFRVAGQLGPTWIGPKSDGSIISVPSLNLNRAKKYAELYKEKMKKEVKIIVTNRIDDSYFVPQDFYNSKEKGLESSLNR